MRIVIALTASVALASLALAQSENLGMPRSETIDIMAAAATRLGIAFEAQPEECNEFLCRWSIGHGVGFHTMIMDGRTVYQLEAGWNTEDRATSISSPELYRGLCAIIVASANPDLSTEEVWEIASQIAILETAQPFAVDTEKRTPDLVLYGERNRPDGSHSPEAAFLQCGAVANTSGDL